MSSNNIEERIKRIISEILLSNRGLKIDLTNDLSLVDSGILDSLSVVRTVQMLQDEFDIELEVSDITLDNFDTIDLISKLVEERLT
jgi:acyl carrier protein